MPARPARPPIRPASCIPASCIGEATLTNSNTLKFHKERLRFASLRAADSRSEHLSRKKCDKGNELRYVSAPARIGRASRGVAQLAERRSPKPKVGGSRPSAPAKHCLLSLGRTPDSRFEANRLRQIGATS